VTASAAPDAPHARIVIAIASLPTRPAPFDWAGQLLAVVALAMLVYGLIEGGHIGFAL